MAENYPYIIGVLSAVILLLGAWIFNKHPVEPADNTKKELEKQTKEEEKKLDDQAVVDQQKTIDQHTKAVDVEIADLKTKTQDAGDDSKKVNDILMDTGKDIRG